VSPEGQARQPCFISTPVLMSRERSSAEDLAHAAENPTRGSVRAFTDGALEDHTHTSPKCGWGSYLTWGLNGNHATGHGSMMSVPTNFEAESEAVLRAILRTELIKGTQKRTSKLTMEATPQGPVKTGRERCGFSQQK
jgi:hypothetical protein